MIHTEYCMTREDGVRLYRTYDDTGHRIRQEQTGAVYDEAIDVAGKGYTYVVTDELIERDDEDNADQSE